MPTAEDLHEQLSWHWEQQLRPRLEGLTVEEALWQPAPGWSVVDGRLEGTWPTPVPAPVTTIAWRLGHLGQCLAHRASAHFGTKHEQGGDRSYDDTVPVEDLLGFVDRAWSAWSAGVLGCDEARFARPHQGPPGTADERYPLWAVVLHVNREVIHHGAEVALLRDLWAAR